VAASAVAANLPGSGFLASGPAPNEQRGTRRPCWATPGSAGLSGWCIPILSGLWIAPARSASARKPTPPIPCWTPHAQALVPRARRACAWAEKRSKRLRTADPPLGAKAVAGRVAPARALPGARNTPPEGAELWSLRFSCKADGRILSLKLPAAAGPGGLVKQPCKLRRVSTFQTAGELPRASRPGPGPASVRADRAGPSMRPPHCQEWSWPRPKPSCWFANGPARPARCGRGRVASPQPSRWPGQPAWACSNPKRSLRRKSRGSAPRETLEWRWEPDDSGGGHLDPSRKNWSAAGEQAAAHWPVPAQGGLGVEPCPRRPA